MHDAESAFRTAQLLRPDAAPPYINLGHLLENAGRKEEAAKLYRTAILRGLDPDLFSQYLAALSAADAPDRSPDSWVRATFDNFAPSFDRHLRALRYRVPELLADAVAAVGRPPGDVADLGCGTGLCGAAIAGQRPRSITGVDLSPAMLALANSRRVYTTLVENEVHKWLAQTEAATLDLVLAADVFIYVGNLDALFELVGRVLRSGGLFGFSVERDDASDYSLRATGRYAQSASYINRLASRQFDTLVCQAQIIRNESAVAVDGLLYLLQARF
jgi:predicted TPR repeat methyltransferase